MKTSILKNVFNAFVATGLIVSVTSCSKNELPIKSSPKSDEINSVNTENSRLSSPASTLVAFQSIFGVGRYGIGTEGLSLYSNISPTNGIPANSVPLINLSTGLSDAFGVAKVPGANNFIVTAIDGVTLGGSGTALYTTDLTGTMIRRGTIPYQEANTKLVEDIEYNTVDGFLYGVSGNYLVRIGTGGTNGLGSCSAPTAVAPTVVKMGTLGTVGNGPYSISFNYAGKCAIMSASDSKRAYVNLVPSTSPVTLYTSVTILSATNYSSITETASFISGMTQFVSIAGLATPTSSPSKAFYQLTTSYQLIGSKCLRDYTSTPVYEARILDK